MTTTNHVITGEHIGMALQLDTADDANCEYFKHCANGEFHLQACTACSLLRYPPTSACPWCGHELARFQPVESTGCVYTYAEVHHAIQPAFTDYLPYSILIVELDTQRDQPGPNDALRVAGNLANPDGTLASIEDVEHVGIGSRVRMIFKPIAPDFALPLWTLDDTTGGDITGNKSTSNRGEPVWRYPQ